MSIATTADLSDNSITDDEAVTLASSIKQASKLTKFALQSSLLTNAGVRALTEALAACPADVAVVDLPALAEAEEATIEKTPDSGSASQPGQAKAEAKAQEEAEKLAKQEEAAAEKAAAEAAEAAAAAEAEAKAKAEAEAQVAKAEAKAKAAAEEEKTAAETKAAAAAAAVAAASKRTATAVEIPDSFKALPANTRDVVEALMFHAYAQERKTIRSSDIEVATLAVGNPAELAIIFSAANTPEKRAEGVKTAFAKLPSAMRELKREVTSLVEAGKLPLLVVSSEEPFEMKPTKDSYIEFFTAQAICKGYHLPTESAEPWRWSQWWEPIVKRGQEIGPEFVKGLHSASTARADSSLKLRSRVGGHRPTSLKAIGMLIQVSQQVDLRDNRLTDDECPYLAKALESAPKLTQLNMAGNRFTSDSAISLSKACEKSESRIQTIDFSRNRFCSGDSVDDMLAAVGGLNAMAVTLSLGRSGINDEQGAKLLPAFKLSLAESIPRITKLDLSRNGLGALSMGAMAQLFAACPGLSHLDLSRNELGVAGGSAIAAALAKSSLRVLDISATNICDCVPIAPTSIRGDWSGDALAALAVAIAECDKLTDVYMNNVGLCGVWNENICGDVIERGTYTPVAIDSLLTMFDNGRVSLKRDGLHLSEGNHVSPTDGERIIKALKDNASKPIKKDASAFEKNMLSMMGSDDKSPEKKLDANAAVGVEAQPVALDIEIGAPSASQLRNAAGKKGAGEQSMGAGVLKELAPMSVGDAGGEEESQEQADWRLRRDAELKAEEAQHENKEKADKREAEKKRKDELEAEKAASQDTRDRRSAGTGGSKAVGKIATEKAGAKTAKGGEGAAKKGGAAASTGSGLTPRTAKTKGEGGGGTGLTPRTAKTAGDGGGDEAKGAPDAKAAKAHGYGQATGKGKKKKVVEAVVEEAPNPFRDAPLMIAMVNLVARKDIAVSSPLVDSNPKVSAGALMRVSQTEVLTENARGKVTSEHRMFVALDGDTEPLGWVTGISKDETENLKLAGAGFPLMCINKALNCREGIENDSKKLEDIPKKTTVRVMEMQTMADGTEKALVAKDLPVADPIGWVIARKEGSDAKSLEPVAVLQLTFDLKVHTANALSNALGRIKEPPKRKKNDATALPFQLAGRRPITRPEDGPSASRHRLVETPASTTLIFNCFEAQFEVTSWAGDVPFEKLSGESSFDLISKHSRKRLGRVGLAKELGQPFLERVEFPDDWLVAEDHGVVHDGWQGNGILDLELTWNKAVATIRVLPWLAYGCTVGARFLIRKLGMAEGQCATVQRILGDDRVVARVDGYSKTDGVKGETIVDLQPSTVVRTTSVGYARETKVLVLHNGKLANGQVLLWLGGTDHMEGSRHMVNIKSAGASTGSHAWYDFNMYNHVAVDGEMTQKIFEDTRMTYCIYIMGTEDKVEDAITGNHLNIKDQLIFMEAYNVPNGCNPPEYMNLADVPALVKMLVMNSPKRANGTHVAQPILCRAGPGTGKTWMVKQSLFLLAEILGGDNPGEGIRLVPIVVFVQRIVRLLNELGDDPSELLKDPNGMMRWYIGNQFADKVSEKQLLLLAYEMRSLVILVDGVDEAAGMRDIVEAFVHYELVTSGNRLVVTSRPEGVDLEDYKNRFVVMNLKELSQEQQRNVIQMQLQGNAFFEHLVNIAECRKELDAAYQVFFKSEALRNEIESCEYSPADVAGEEEVKETEDKAGDGDEKPADETHKEADKDGKDGKAGEADMQRRGSVVKRGGGGDAAHNADDSYVPMVRRRLAMDNQQEMQEFMHKVTSSQTRLTSKFLVTLDTCMTKKAAVFNSFLEQLDAEIKNLPSPCTRAHLEPAIRLLAEAQPGKVFDKGDAEVDEQMRESLVQLGLQRKLPVAGGRRGAKAAPIPAQGLWYQIIQHADEKYLAVEHYVPVMMYVLGTLAAAVGIRDLALQVDEATGRPIPGSEKSQPGLTYRDPVDLWLASTYPGATEPAERPPTAWVASALMRCDSGDQCLGLIRRLVAGVEVAVGNEAATFTMLGLKNAFDPEFNRPTHLRNASCHMLLTFRGSSVAVNVQVEHKELLATFTNAQYIRHNEYFWHRMLNISEDVYDLKFETLLRFLVEAIGVPVLLSLLLLTYSNTTGGEVIDLDELPEGRLQLYKLGIMSGIKKRLLITLAALSAGSGAAQAAQGAAEEEAQAAENRPKRERRKGALEQSLGATGPATGGGQATENSKQTKHATNEPVLDLNSMLRGKKVRVVTGEDDVAEAYSLVVRVLDKSKQAGFDLRSGIVMRCAQVAHDACDRHRARRVRACADGSQRGLAARDRQEDAPPRRGRQPGERPARVHFEACGVLPRGDSRGARPVVTARPRLRARRRTDGDPGKAVRQGSRAVPVQASLLPGGLVRRAPAAPRHIPHASQRHRLAWLGIRSDGVRVPEQPLHEQHLPHRRWPPGAPAGDAAAPLGLPRRAAHPKRALGPQVYHRRQRPGRVDQPVEQRRWLRRRARHLATDHARAPTCDRSTYPRTSC